MSKATEAISPDYLTTAEVAVALRTPTETVRYWRHVGKGPKSFKVGRRVLYSRGDLAAWMSANGAPASLAATDAPSTGDFEDIGPALVEAVQQLTIEVRALRWTMESAAEVSR